MNSIIKNRIRRSFNKAKLSYDLNDDAQRKVCQESIELLRQSNKCFKVVSDIACGTGSSTLALMKNIKCEKVTAVDFSDMLLEVAREKLKHFNVECILGDFDDKLLPEKSQDLIFCNMGLQWSLDLNKTIKILLSSLKEKGSLAFSIPLEGTFKELHGSYRNKLLMAKDIKILLEQLRAESIIYQHLSFSQPYDSWLDALRSIKGVGANCLIDRGELNRKKLIKTRADFYFLEKDNCSLTYQVGIFIASKSKD